MNARLVRLHLKVAKKSGEAYACGNKEKYVTEEDAESSAKYVNKSGRAYYEVSPYPCPFCNWWHIGRKMALDELMNY